MMFKFWPSITDAGPSLLQYCPFAWPLATLTFLHRSNSSRPKHLAMDEDRDGLLERFKPLQAYRLGSYPMNNIISGIQYFIIMI